MTKSKISILIVGGTGFIGYHLAKESLNKGWSVTSLSSRRPKKIRFLKKVKYIICDIGKKRSLDKKIKKSFTYVVNLGGYVDHSKRKKTFNSHYLGCKNLSEIFLKKYPKCFLQIGSSGEYGKIKSPQKETYKCRPISVYGKAKFLASKHLVTLFKRKKFPSVILRLYQIYGPNQDFNRFIPAIIRGCLNNERFPCSAGTQLRDFLYIKDLTNAIFKSLGSKKAIGQIINVGSGKPKKIKEIILKIKKILKKGYPQFGKIKLREDEGFKIYPTIKKAKKQIKWKPKISFEKGLKRTIKSYLQRKIGA
tara:strand:+ start:2217 stop:3137 length:921 start_codon:yes stop_codon:yes gene_type:complete